jgi:hypothetical protein
MHVQAMEEGTYHLCVQVLSNTAGSADGATALTVVLLVIAFFACIAIMVTSSRRLFSGSDMTQ